MDGFFFVAQLMFKQAKFYFRFQNDRTKGRMGPSWAVTSLQKSYFESSIAGGRSDILYICCLQYEKSGNTKQDISPAIKDSKYEFWKVRHINYPTWTHSSFCAVSLNPEVKFCLFEC